MPHSIDVSLQTRRRLDIIKQEVLGDEPTAVSDETVLHLMMDEVLNEDTALEEVNTDGTG